MMRKLQCFSQVLLSSGLLLLLGVISVTEVMAQAHYNPAKVFAVVGTQYDPMHKSSAAIIENTLTRDQDTFLIGDTIAPDISIKDILPDRVIIEQRNHEPVALFMSGGSSPIVNVSKKLPKKPFILPTYLVSMETMMDALANPNDFISGIESSSLNTSEAGLFIARDSVAGEKSLIGLFQLKQGDQITSVNSNSVSSIDDIFETITAPQGDYLSVVIKRDGDYRRIIIKPEMPI